jgi:cell wall-active antibiotic response 4TMS protein YvqF
MGPAILITLGVLFLLSQMHGGRFNFDNTWPVLLVVIGVLLLASSLAPKDGHIEVQNTAVPPPPLAPPVNPPQTPNRPQGQ